jgi:hypothetical protein
MATARTAHAAALLPSSQVLVTGGYASPTEEGYVDSAELWGAALPTGTIQVSTNLASATFTIAGPATYNGSGQAFTQTNAPAGTYTITYNPANCYATPPSESQTLTAGGALNFTGQYQFQCGIALSSATIFVGLKTSDDQGTSFDIRIEFLKNGAVIAAGQTNCVAGLTRNTPASVTLPFGTPTDSTAAPGDTLSFRVLARIGTNADATKCAGHANATGLRLHYDGTARPSKLGLQLGATALTDRFLHTTAGVDFFNTTAPTAATALFKDSAGVNFLNGNPFRLVGTWSTVVP